MITDCITSRDIQPSDKAVVCLGDSFTQGQGAWSTKTWESHNNRIDHTIIKGEIEVELYSNSWPTQLINSKKL